MPKQIVVVDDDQMARNTMITCVRQACPNVEIVEYRDGYDFCKELEGVKPPSLHEYCDEDGPALRKEDVLLVITDMEMPVVRGPELIGRLSEDYFWEPAAILVSGSSMAESRKQFFLQCGFVAVMNKYCTIEEMVREIKIQVGSYD